MNFTRDPGIRLTRACQRFGYTLVYPGPRCTRVPGTRVYPAPKCSSSFCMKDRHGSESHGLWPHCRNLDENNVVFVWTVSKSQLQTRCWTTLGYWCFGVGPHKFPRFVVWARGCIYRRTALPTDCGLAMGKVCASAFVVLPSP